MSKFTATAWMMQLERKLSDTYEVVGNGQVICRGVSKENAPEITAARDSHLGCVNALLLLDRIGDLDLSADVIAAGLGATFSEVRAQLRLVVAEVEEMRKQVG